MGRPLDTAADAERRQVAVLRVMAPSDRLRIADQLSTETRALSAAGIARRHPGWSAQQRIVELARVIGVAAADRP